MNIITAEYLLSSPDLKHCPKGNIPEFAFAGRSNVGKSTLINMLTGFSELAKISSKPGKTRMINFFLINENWRLVDLPGYGYAGVSKETRLKWQEMIANYLIKREQLTCVFVLIDSRIEPQKIDMEFINRLGEKEIPFAVVFTKTDKISGLAQSNNMQLFKKKMSETWESLPKFFSTSSRNKTGRTEILGFIQGIVDEYSKS